MDEPNEPTKDATLVRGADGKLYLISKDLAPLELKGAVAEVTTAFLTTVERELTTRLGSELGDKLKELAERLGHSPAPFGQTHNVHVVFKDVVPRE